VCRRRLVKMAGANSQPPTPKDGVPGGPFMDGQDAALLAGGKATGYGTANSSVAVASAVASTTIVNNNATTFAYEPAFPMMSEEPPPVEAAPVQVVVELQPQQAQSAVEPPPEYEEELPMLPPPARVPTHDVAVGNDGDSFVSYTRRTSARSLVEAPPPPEPPAGARSSQMDVQQLPRQKSTRRSMSDFSVGNSSLTASDFTSSTLPSIPPPRDESGSRDRGAGPESAAATSEPAPRCPPACLPTRKKDRNWRE